jgi:hypothetical protein
MEVKQSEKSESASDYGGSFSGSANFGIFKASVSGSVSAHSSNTRSSDNSAKYHVDVSANNHGTPEGLARVLDMMAANVAPTIASSTAVDESGKPLVGDKKSKNDNLKRLRLQKSQLETAYSSAEKAFDTAIINFKREGMSKKNSFTVNLQSKINAIDIDSGSDEEKAAAQKQLTEYTSTSHQLTECWNNFQNTAKDSVMSVASSGNDTAITSIFILEGIDEQMKLIKFSAADETNGLTVLNNNYKSAVEAYKAVLKIKQQLDEIDMKYNEAIYGISIE